MIYFLLPNSFAFTYRHIKYQSEKEQNTYQPQVSFSLSQYLNEIKEKINEHQTQWDKYKKYTNPYEYIHTIVPNKNKPVSKYKPLSRSFFKMIEILQSFQFSFPSQDFRSFHLAEGPGGFIEALLKTRKNSNDTYVGMTLQEDKNDSHIPTWRKSDQIMREKNIFIENGADNTGNILSLNNFIYCKTKYASKMHFISADGGFDFSADFNHQEKNISKLLFAQVCYAICMQLKGGNFVLKIFDCFMPQTVDILFILSSFYQKVYITKPQTSRYANSEKYIICDNFLFRNIDEIYPFLLLAFKEMLLDDGVAYRFLDYSVPLHFLTKLEEYNSIFGQQQIDNIHYTLSLIETKNNTDKIETLIKTNVQKSINWCIKYRGVGEHNVPNASLSFNN
jgi:23S rRNA U2552 (ribose-2'-O)-methylase RlmE/FtsJ